MLELVEGEDLRERLARGAIPVDEALEIADLFPALPLEAATCPGAQVAVQIVEGAVGHEIDRQR